METRHQSDLWISISNSRQDKMAFGVGTREWFEGLGLCAIDWCHEQSSLTNRTWKLIESDSRWATNRSSWQDVKAKASSSKYAPTRAEMTPPSIWHNQVFGKSASIYSVNCSWHFLFRFYIDPWSLTKSSHRETEFTKTIDEWEEKKKEKWVELKKARQRKYYLFVVDHRRVGWLLVSRFID